MLGYWKTKKQKTKKETKILGENQKAVLSTGLMTKRSELTSRNCVYLVIHSFKRPHSHQVSKSVFRDFEEAVIIYYDSCSRSYMSLYTTIATRSRKVGTRSPQWMFGKCYKQSGMLHRDITCTCSIRMQLIWKWLVGAISLLWVAQTKKRKRKKLLYF